MIILGTNSIKDTGFNVANSLRFNDGSSDNLSRSTGTPSSRQKFTFSTWIKLSSVSGNRSIFNIETDGNTTLFFMVKNGDQLHFVDYNSSAEQAKLTTNALYRDPSAWMHVVLRLDSTQGTNTNRCRLYVNGSEVTSFSATVYPSQNYNFTNNVGNTRIGVSQGNANYWDGYMAETVYCDNQSLAPDQFGEFDEDSGIWKPIDVSGLTFGDEGFYLDYENSGALGTDVSGESNNFTVNNLTAIDQSTDTCTNNFATGNPLDNGCGKAPTFSEGNLKILHDNPSPVFSTIGVSSGKWYMEAKAISGNNDYQIGICSTQVTTNSDEIGLRANDWGYKASDGKYKNNGSDNSYGSTYANGNIIGVYLDLDNNKLYFAKNGTIQNSGTGISITAPGSTPLGAYFFALGANAANTKYTWEVNFGNPTYTGTDQTDANGYGSFEYDPSAGTFDSASKDFYALNTKNLAEYG